jgi:hypothetical protein
MPTKTNPPELYRKHFIDKQDERLELFTLLSERFSICSVLYPGSFTHLTPSFVFPVTSYVDSDRRAARFFTDPTLLDFVRSQKTYPEAPEVRFHPQDYTQAFEEEPGSFDLLISQYAGFVSQACKRYLKPGGVLLANNSHGDAGMACLDPDYAFIAAVNRRGEKFSLVEKNLEAYFVPKKEIKITKAYLERTSKGVGYRKSAFSYLFRRVG